MEFSNLLGPPFVQMPVQRGQCLPRRHHAMLLLDAKAAFPLHMRFGWLHFAPVTDPVTDPLFERTEGESFRRVGRFLPSEHQESVYTLITSPLIKH